MAFWENVLIELDYRGMTNKALAEKCGFDASNIGRGLRLGSSPSVETAVKIAKALEVSVEYLVTGNESNQTKAVPTNQIQLMHKYSKTITTLDLLPDSEKIPILHLIEEMGKNLS